MTDSNAPASLSLDRHVAVTTLAAAADRFDQIASLMKLGSALGLDLEAPLDHAGVGKQLRAWAVETLAGADPLGLCD